MEAAGAALLVIVPDAWTMFVHYATFHMPPEPNGIYRYNALQHLTYSRWFSSWLPWRS